MAIEVAVKVNETRAALVAASLRAVGGDLLRLTNVHRRIGRIIAARARALVPTRTGVLRRSLRAFGSADAAGVNYDSRAAYYALIVARGHRLPQGGHVAATDYDVNALEQTRPEWQDEYTREIDSIIADNGLNV